MAPSNGSDESTYVVCASCGSKARRSWSFCRSCDASLEDAESATSAIRTEDAPDLGPSGCPKCGHEEADVGEVATTGTGFSMLFDLQINQFRAVSCANCGYTEFYRNGDSGVVLDLFLGE